MSVAHAGAEGVPDGQRKSSIIIKGKVLATYEREIPHSHLQYYPDNPRVYSLVRAETDQPTQDEIEEELQDSEHVRELVQDIRRNGGLIDPLVVKNGTLEVIEGNSRLAAWRVLAKQDPMRWISVKCILLPKDITQTQVSALLGQWHLKGKKEWRPYEQAGYLWRRHKQDGITYPDLADEVGLGKTKVKQLAEAFEFMGKHGDVKRDRFSYYYEYTRSSKIGRARKKFAKLDEVVVGQIKAGQIIRAQDLRDMLPVICNKEKILRTFIQDDVPLSDAHSRAEKAGGGHKPSQKLKAFRNWIAKPEVQAHLATADGSIRQEIAFEVGKLRSLIERVHKKLTK
jgi:hypothetical protein